MTETDVLPGPVESDVLGADGTGAQAPLRSRFLLPVLTPFLSIAVVAVLVLDISRVFLAGDADAAFVTGIALTAAIMSGATLIAAAPRLRSSTIAVILAGVFLLVSGAGLVSLGPSIDEGRAATGYQQPSGPAKATVPVVAEASISFDAKAYRAPAGVVRFELSGVYGHELAIQDPKFDGFLLGSSPGNAHSGKVELAPGTYTLYCPIGDHAALGMKATLIVTK
jgi:plastocyanin